MQSGTFKNISTWPVCTYTKVVLGQASFEFYVYYAHSPRISVVKMATLHTPAANILYMQQCECVQGQQWCTVKELFLHKHYSETTGEGKILTIFELWKLWELWKSQNVLERNNILSLLNLSQYSNLLDSESTMSTAKSKAEYLLQGITFLS